MVEVFLYANISHLCIYFAAVIASKCLVMKSVLSSCQSGIFFLSSDTKLPDLLIFICICQGCQCIERSLRVASICFLCENLGKLTKAAQQGSFISPSRAWQAVVFAQMQEVYKATQQMSELLSTLISISGSSSSCKLIVPSWRSSSMTSLFKVRWH